MLWVVAIVAAGLALGCRRAKSPNGALTNLPPQDPNKPWVFAEGVLPMEFETVRKQGLVLVHYDPSSREQPMAILAECSVADFEYTQFDVQTPTIYSVSAEQGLAAGVGFLGAGQIQAHLSAGQRLMFTTNGVRSFINKRSVTVPVPPSASCKEATHFVQRFIVGSWSWLDSSEVAGSASTSGVGVGGGDRLVVQQSAGNTELCSRHRAQGPDDIAPCDVIVGVVLAPLNPTEGAVIAKAGPAGDFVAAFAEQVGLTRQIRADGLKPVLEKRAKTNLPPGAQPVVTMSGDAISGGVVSSTPSQDSFLMLPGWCYAVLASGGPTVSGLTVQVTVGGLNFAGRDGDRTAALGHRGPCLTVPPILGVPLPQPAALQLSSKTPGVAGAQVYRWPAR